MDTFVAALKVGPTGRVVGVDMTDAQLAKAERLAARDGFGNVTYRKAYIEDTGLRGGHIRLRHLQRRHQSRGRQGPCVPGSRASSRSGGRLAIADIVTEHAVARSVVCNADLWAACIGGAAQQDDYRTAIETAGLRVERVEENHGVSVHLRPREAGDREVGREERVAFWREAVAGAWVAT